MTAATLLRDARTDAGLTQSALARLAGTSQPAVARYEKGVAAPRADTLERLLAACGRGLGTTQRTPRAVTVPAAGPRGRTVRRHLDEILAAVSSAGLTNPRLFGSTARGEDTDRSDVDLLVDLGPDGDHLAIYELQDRLQALLRVSVDVTTESILKPHVRATALRDALPL